MLLNGNDVTTPWRRDRAPQFTTMSAQPENLLPFPDMPDKKKVRKVFVQPTIDDCQAYGKEIGLPPEEVERFFDRNETTGWQVSIGKTTIQMSCWKGAMRTWKRNVPVFAAQRQQFNRAQPTAPRPEPLWVQIKAVEELINKSRAYFKSVRYVSNHTAEEARKLKEWQARLKQLKEIQANGGV